VDRARLRVAGTLSAYVVEADSGFPVCREFCPVCGSPVFGSTERFPDACSVYAASLDDPSRFKPQHVIFQESAQPWDYVDQILDG